MDKLTHEEIEDLLAGITPGEWRAECDTECYVWAAQEVARSFAAPICVTGDSGENRSHEHAAFIAAAPSIVRQLLAEVKALEADRDYWQHELMKASAVLSSRLKEWDNLNDVHNRLLELKRDARNTL